MSGVQRPSEPPSGSTEELSVLQRAKQAVANGPLSWMAKNHVASNLLMALLLAGGLMALPNIKQEVFPEFDLDLITVGVPYPGASPAEVEQGVVLAVEEAVRGLHGVKEVRSVATEGAGNVTVELLAGTDRDRALSDIKSAVDRIASFPGDAERPLVSLVTRKRGVLSLILYGDTDDKTLRELAERTRHGLLQQEGITLAEIQSERPLEVSVEVSQENLRRYGLTLDQIAGVIRNASIELPAGGIKTAKGEVLVRVAERRQWGAEFEDIVVLSRADGTSVLLGDIATIDDGFSESDRESLYDGKPAIRLQVYRIGEEGPVDVSAAVHAYTREHASDLPDGIRFAVWSDRSEMFADRVGLLRRNSIVGLILVIAVLGLFLELRLAFWVTMGIPISFVGSLIFLPGLDVSINMISLFAFIVTLGMVVDDAIIVGEAVYTQQRKGLSWAQASVAGVREVAAPVTFSILTTIIAFTPLLFVPGPAGKFFRNIPWVVIAVLLVSLLEGLFVLPAHLGAKKHFLTSAIAAPFVAVDHISEGVFGVRIFAWLVARQRVFSGFIEDFVMGVYTPVLGWCLRHRYLALSIGIALLMFTVGLVAGGRAKFTFLPKIDGDVVTARVEMPVGTPVEVTSAHQFQISEALEALIEELGGRGVIRGVFAEVGGPGVLSNTGGARSGSGGGHVADVMVLLVPSDDRPFASSEFARRWREKVGEIPGAESLSFSFATGHGSGPPVDVRLSHPNPDILEQAAERLAVGMRAYAGTYDVKDGTSRGKEQLDFTLTAEGRSLGLDARSLARQVRAAFYGAEAVRQQRGRSEMRVFVRRPRSERHSESDLEQLMLRTPDGGEIPLLQAANVHRSRAYTRIRRADGRRMIDVTADVDEAQANAATIMASLKNRELPALLGDVGQLTYTFEGQGRERAEMMGGLGRGFIAAVCAMFALLAVAFKSYVQPALVLLAIPFGMIGAVWGHMVMGYSLSLMTMFGVVALSGVVVNDSLVLVDAVNRYRAEGMMMWDAVLAGGQRRFRPILLTSLTTFFGLTPMILETSTPSRFLIPMAISLGFGVLFATFVILLLVPCSYLVLEDLVHLRNRATRALGMDSGGQGGVD